MHSLQINHNYEQKLREAQPTFFASKTIKPPPGVMGDISTIPQIIIPPLNTNIQFNIPNFQLSQNRGLAALEIPIPTNFNWRTNAKDKGKEGLIVTPGNQMLCGSCWAIASAGVISDNFVVSGMVDWYPNLSTTWILMCYKQNQCQGGNPAKAFTDIATGGLVSNHCIDYSWCSKNNNCHVDPTKHFTPDKNFNLSTLIPDKCGCYDDSEFFYYQIADNSQNISIGAGDVTEANITSLVQKHILQYGPVLGGFIVFKNFMHGDFTKINGGVYLENVSYDGGKMVFDPTQSTAANYMGSHAIAIIGWGTEPNVVVDAQGTKKDVPYWYCRNSWTENWGDGGYFKMAMYPYNKIAQFDAKVILNTPQGNVQGGGMVMLQILKPPVKKSLPQLKDLASAPKEQDPTYYSSDPNDPPKIIVPNKPSTPLTYHQKNVLMYSGIVIFVTVIISIVYFRRNAKIVAGIIIGMMVLFLIILGVTAKFIKN